MIRSPENELVDIDVDADVEETGGVECEEVILGWCRERGDRGITAEELHTWAQITLSQAQERLANLWENDFLRVDPPGIPHGRFFLVKGDMDG